VESNLVVVGRGIGFEWDEAEAEDLEKDEDEDEDLEKDEDTEDGEADNA